MSISVRDLSFSYGTRRCAGSEHGSGPYDVLRHVSFDLPDGALTCVLGPNGAGKSTLFRCMLCLEDDYTGAVEVNGRDLRSLPVRERAREVAFIPQSHDAVYDYSVLDMVLMSAAPEVGAFGAPGAAQVDRAWEALERVGIARLAHRPATQISGGEQQLVLIARALAQHARTIIMDEPTSALDYGNTMRVLGCVRQLAREGLCIVQSTHQPDQAFLFADAVLALDRGRVRAFGAPKDVVTEGLIEDLYGVDVTICSLFDDRMRVCVPVSEIDGGEAPEGARDLGKAR